MAVILNIETSTNVCSVALTLDGYILFHCEDFNGPNHAAILSDFIFDALKYIDEHDNMQLNAISISLGPGSYTGLRIGLSEAKGLAYGLRVPLIGINTLKILGVSAMFRLHDFNPDDDLLIPMIDARRNEVYTMVLDGSLNEIAAPHALILNDDSLNFLKSDQKRLVFVGNGAEKARNLISFSKSTDTLFLPDISPVATDMCPLSEQKYINSDFIDLAYSVPFYIKDFQATQPKNKIL